MGLIDRICAMLTNTRVNPKSVEQLMLPITVSGWIFGMGITEIPLRRPWPVMSVLWALFLISGYGLVVKRTMEHLDALITTSSTSGRIVFTALFYGNVGLNICGTVLGWMRMKGVKNIVKRLESSDARMEKMGIPRNYLQIYVKQIIAIVGQFAVIILFMILTFNWSTVTEISISDRIMGALATYYPVLPTTVGDISFITLVRFVTMRFNQLNKCLMKMSTTTDESPQHKRVLEYTRWKIFDADHAFEKGTKDDANAMRCAREYHHELIKISYMINDTFGIQALLSMAISFALITGLLYQATSLILWTAPSQEIVDEELLNAVCWLLFYSWRIVLVNSVCATASSAAKKTGTIICHLHEPSTKKTYRDEIRDFTLQMTQHSLTFTACGFFALNYRLIQGMIGSITTYLVILIQIGEVPASGASTNTTKKP